MLKLTDEGYVFISSKGIRYEILEGVSIGGMKKYTSDIFFIMMCDCNINVDTPIVDYLFGASNFEDNPSEYEGSIKDLVEEYETRNRLEEQKYEEEDDYE